MRDILFLLGPTFRDAKGDERYCGDSVSVEGMISFIPAIKSLIDVRYLEAARPRQALVSLIGEANQSLPVLILMSGQSIKDQGISTQTGNGHIFINNEADIRRYLAAQYGLPSSA